MRDITRALLPLAAGAAVCLADLFGLGALCASSGCAVYAGANIFGMPIAGIGLAAFLAALALTLAGKRRLAAAVVAGMFLGDIGFLAFQTIFLPCTACLAAAACILWARFAHAQHLPLPKGAVVPATIIFALLASLAAADAVRERAKPWPMYGDPSTAKYEVWFSMDCQKCREAIEEMLGSDTMGNQVVLYPVSKGAADREKLGVLWCGLGHGFSLDEALSRGWGVKQCEYAAKESLGATDNLLLDLRLLWNKSLFLRKGLRTVPIFISNKLLVVGNGENSAKSTKSAPQSPAEAGMCLPDNDGCEVK